MSRSLSDDSYRDDYASSSLYTSDFARDDSQIQVSVRSSTNLKQLRLIHKTLKSLLAHDSEFETLLMSRKKMQTDEKWFWIWNSRSADDVYYQWWLWNILINFSWRAQRERNLNIQLQQIFENDAAWAMLKQKLSFEYMTRLDEIISDSKYDSFEDKDSDDENRRRYAQHHDEASSLNESSLDIDQQFYLNLMQKAKLIHLLAQLSNTNARLRRDDVAWVTVFAIQHAGKDVNEIVQMIVANVHQSYAFISANSDRIFQDVSSVKYVIDDIVKVEEKTLTSEDDDTTLSKLISLYLISNILFTSSTSDVRHVWRYRALFETALKTHKTFEHLEHLDKILNWDRLKAEKWKRSVHTLLSLWKDWCVFSQTSQKFFTTVFTNSSLTSAEKTFKAKKQKEKREKEKNKSKWKSVEDRKTKIIEDTMIAAETELTFNVMNVNDFDEESMQDDEEDLDDKFMMNDENVDEESMKDQLNEHSSIESQVKVKSSVMTKLSRRETLAASIAAKLNKAFSVFTKLTKSDLMNADSDFARKRQRSKAENMFIDSNDDE